jgi:hypothetical protein
VPPSGAHLSRQLDCRRFAGVRTPLTYLLVYTRVSGLVLMFLYYYMSQPPPSWPNAGGRNKRCAPAGAPIVAGGF